jgi:hypothetical protein
MIASRNPSGETVRQVPRTMPAGFDVALVIFAAVGDPVKQHSS